MYYRQVVEIETSSQADNLTISSNIYVYLFWRHGCWLKMLILISLSFVFLYMVSTATRWRNQQMPPQTKYVDIYHVSDVYPVKMSHIALILSRSFQIFSRTVCFSSIKATSGCASQANNFVLYCTLYLNGTWTVLERGGKKLGHETGNRSRFPIRTSNQIPIWMGSRSQF